MPNPAMTMRRFLEVIEASVPPRGLGKHARGRRRLLVVGGDHARLKRAKMRLERAGLAVATAGDATEALALARQSPPDLILSDIFMPDIDGVRLCLAIRSDAELGHIPVLLLPRVDNEDSGRTPARDPDWTEVTVLAGEERYRSLFDGVPVGLYRTTLEGRILDVNPGFVQVMGYPNRETLLAMSAAEFYVDPAVRAQWTALLERDGVVAGFESQVRRFDGSTIWLRANARAVRDPSGRTAYLEGAVVDITEQKRAEEVTRRRAAHLEALNAIISSAASASNVRQLLEAAVDRALRVLGCKIGVGWTEHVQVLRGISLGAWSSVRRAAQSTGLEVRPTAIPDWHAAEFEPGSVAPVMVSSGVGASVSMPVQVGGRTVGGILIASRASRAWLPEEVLLVEAVGKGVGEAVQRLQLFQAIQRRTTELGAFYDLSRRLRAARSVEEMYPIIVEQAMDILPGGHGSLALLVPERHTLTRVYTVGVPVETSGSTFPVAGSRSGQVVQTGATFVTADLTAEDIPAWLDASRYDTLGPLVIVPLRSEQEIIGTLSVARKKIHDHGPFSDAEVRLLEGIAEIAGTAIRRARLHQNLQQAYVQMVLALAQAMEARDSYTAGHSERMVQLAERIARELGCPEEEVQDIRWGARLHDVGKIGIPDSVLNKPSGLTDVEWNMMRQHPILGEEILKPVERMRAVATLVRHHQERWDGNGYPDRLQGEAIPLGARILAVVDAYGAMTEVRPYKHARSHAEAVAEIQRSAGTQFDPVVVDTFVHIFDPTEPTAWHVVGSEEDA